MATAPVTVSPTTITLEDYLHTIYHPDREYVDGETEERHLGDFEHGRLQGLSAAWFIPHEREWQILTVVEQRMQVHADRVRIPDVCVLRGGAPREKVTKTPPLLCIEILSPEDRWSRVSAVMEDYLAMGVEHLWILDPLERLAYTYTPTGRLKVEGTRLQLPDSPIYLDLPALFAALD